MTGGSYFYLTNPDHLHDVYVEHLQFLTRGRYSLKVGYEQLKVDPSFPSACYAINAQLSMTVEKERNSLTLSARSSIRSSGGAQFDTRIYVCKP